MNVQRHYRGQPSRPIPVWNGILEHLDGMGMAIWLYLWCLDRITREQDGVGFVLGGAPVKIEQVAEELGRSHRALRRDLAKLKSRYLRLRWTPYGYVIHVLNSRKFGIWKPVDSLAISGRAETKNGRALDKSGQAVTENGRSKEDSAVAAVAALPFSSEETPWGFLGVKKACVPASFRSLLETRWASRNGQQRSVLIGETVDDWQDAEDKKLPAPAFFHALAKLRDFERDGRRPNAAPSRIPTVNDVRPKER
jgi:hypothetical protein